jgi:hypothetical protein
MMTRYARLDIRGQLVKFHLCYVDLAQTYGHDRDWTFSFSTFLPSTIIHACTYMQKHILDTFTL